MTWFAAHGIHVQQLPTDNAMIDRHGTRWGQTCSARQLTRRFTKPGCPRRKTTHQPARRLTTTSQVTTPDR
jgi:hypothetical protein